MQRNSANSVQLEVLSCVISLLEQSSEVSFEQLDISKAVSLFHVQLTSLRAGHCDSSKVVSWLEEQ